MCSSFISILSVQLQELWNSSLTGRAGQETTEEKQGKHRTVFCRIFTRLLKLGLPATGRGKYLVLLVTRWKTSSDHFHILSFCGKGSLQISRLFSRQSWLLCSQLRSVQHTINELQLVLDNISPRPWVADFYLLIDHFSPKRDSCQQQQITQQRKVWASNPATKPDEYLLRQYYCWTS